MTHLFSVREVELTLITALYDYNSTFIQKKCRLPWNTWAGIGKEGRRGRELRRIMREEGPELGMVCRQCRQLLVHVQFHDEEPEGQVGMWVSSCYIKLWVVSHVVVSKVIAWMRYSKEKGQENSGRIHDNAHSWRSGKGGGELTEVPDRLGGRVGM